MAISYLSNIDLSNNQLKDFKVDNVTSDPTGLAGEGQMIYRTDTNQMKYHTGSNNWVVFGTGSGSGTVTSVAATHAGNAFTAAIGGNATINPSVDITLDGDSTQYINGAGDLVLISTLPQGDVTAVQASTDDELLGIEVSNSTGPIPQVGLGVDGLTALGSTPDAADTLVIYDDAAGKNKKVSVSNLIAAAPQGDITNINTTSPIGGGGSSGSVTITHDAQSQTNTTPSTTLTSGGTFTALSANVGVNGTGHVTGQTLTTFTMPTIPAAYTGWKLDGDTSGSVISITSGDTVDFIGSTGIDCLAASGAKLTITNTSPFDSLTLAASTGSNSTIANSGTITIAAGTAITTTNDGSGTVTVAYTGGTGSMNNWTLAGDTGSSTIGNGDTATVAGSVGIDTAESGGTVTVNLALSELSTVTAIDPTADFLVGVDGNANEKILYQNVHLNQWGAAEADVAFGSNKLTGVADGSASTDGVNLGQVQALVAGSGLFEGGYNANTGLTTDQSPNGAINGASNIATGLGDFYAVTTAGTQLGVALEVGDLIFANVAIAANSSPANSDFTIVQSGQSIAGVGATDGAATKGIAGFDSAVFTATGNGWIQLIDQSITEQSYGAASKSLTINFDKYGIAQSVSENTISITASQVSDFCTAVDTCVSDHGLTATIGNGSATTYTIDVSSLNTQDLIVQCMRNSAPFDTMFMDVERTSASVLTIKTTVALTTNEVKVLVYKLP